MFDPTWTQRPFVPIATERLLLRLICMSDANALVEQINDIRVSETLARVPYPYSQEDAATFITKSIGEFESAEALVLTILDRKTNKFMGICSIEDQIGFWLGYRYWKQGYGFEAIQALVHFGFTCLDLPILRSSALERNKGSVRIHQKLGFCIVDKKELTSRSTANAEPAFCFELTRNEYFKTLYSQKVPVLWVVAAALVNEEGQLLMAQRPEGKAMAGVWELPGGKIEPGENPEEALARELHEELGIQVDCQDLQPMTFATYHYHTFHLVMPLYVCRKWKGQVSGVEGQAIQWIRYEQLSEIATPAADVSLFHRLAAFLTDQGVW